MRVRWIFPAPPRSLMLRSPARIGGAANGRSAADRQHDGRSRYHGDMIRTQIQITEKQSRDLKRIADARGVSISALVREAVDRIVAERGDDAAWRRALAAVGSVRGGGENVAVDHDRYLADAYEQ